MVHWFGIKILLCDNKLIMVIVILLMLGLYVLVPFPPLRIYTYVVFAFNLSIIWFFTVHSLKYSCDSNLGLSLIKSKNIVPVANHMCYEVSSFVSTSHEFVLSYIYEIFISVDPTGLNSWSCFGLIKASAHKLSIGQ